MFFFHKSFQGLFSRDFFRDVHRNFFRNSPRNYSLAFLHGSQNKLSRHSWKKILYFPRNSSRNSYRGISRSASRLWKWYFSKIFSLNLWRGFFKFSLKENENCFKDYFIKCFGNFYPRISPELSQEIPKRISPEVSLWVLLTIISRIFSTIPQAFFSLKFL